MSRCPAAGSSSENTDLFICLPRATDPGSEVHSTFHQVSCQRVPHPGVLLLSISRDVLLLQRRCQGRACKSPASAAFAHSLLLPSRLFWILLAASFAPPPPGPSFQSGPRGVYQVPVPEVHNSEPPPQQHRHQRGCRWDPELLQLHHRLPHLCQSRM